MLGAYETVVREERDDEERLAQAQREAAVQRAQVEALMEEILSVTAAYGGVEGLALRAGEAASEEEARILGEVQAKVDRLFTARDKALNQAEQLDRLAEQLELRLLDSGVVKIRDRGTSVALHDDPRPAGAALGALAGAIFALLLGLVWRRS